MTVLFNAPKQILFELLPLKSTPETPPTRRPGIHDVSCSCSRKLRPQRRKCQTPVTRATFVQFMIPYHPDSQDYPESNLNTRPAKRCQITSNYEHVFQNLGSWLHLAGKICETQKTRRLGTKFSSRSARSTKDIFAHCLSLKRIVASS